MAQKFKKIKFFDYSLLFMVVLLVAFGLVMIYSSSAYNAQVKYQDPTHMFRRQLFAVGVGVAGIIAANIFGYRLFLWAAPTIYFVTTIVCLLVNFFGAEINGQRRWFNIPGLGSVQPSEFGKVALILMMANLIARRTKQLLDFKFMVKMGAIIAGPMFLFVGLNNLSTALIIAGIAAGMLFVAYPGYKEFLYIMGGGIVLLAGYALIGGGYRASRISTWLNPEASQSDEAYQILQGLYAIGSGGIFGRGLGESIQKIKSLPEAENDMIFSIICEELGVLGALCVIIMYVVILWRIFVIANSAASLEASCICIGVLVHIGLQAILNIAVATNSMPNTGVSLPFISYGGSAAMCTLFEIGLVLSVSRGVEMDV